MSRADYQACREQFLSDSDSSILGCLTENSLFAVEQQQRNAWLWIINHLKGAVADLPEGYVFLEFAIPRMGRRVDAVVLSGGSVFVLEYKVGSEKFHSADVDQVVGYALDLKNFHEPSHCLPIFPILIATHAKPVGAGFCLADDGVGEPILSNGGNLAQLILDAVRGFGGDPIDPVTWVDGRYKPTPTIIEAAQALYRDHQVNEITRSEAGAENLSSTASYVSWVIEESKRNASKSICFITGVPGSGKTLAGLNIANLRTKAAEDEYAVFLSG